MFDVPGAQKGIDSLTQIIEAERILRLQSYQPVAQGFAYYIVVGAYNKAWAFVLSGNNLADFPKNAAYQKSAREFAHGVARRIRNPILDGFFCRSGRPVSIEVDSATQPLPSRAASAVSVSVTDVRDNAHAGCYVVISHQQSIFELKQDPFLIQSAVVNSVRLAVDNQSVSFCPPKDNPPNLEEVRLILSPGKTATQSETDEFLRRKLNWLAFRAGNSSSRIWIPDAWDAAYLGCENKILLQQAEILEANEELIFDDAHEFASIGKSLLRKVGISEQPKVATNVLESSVSDGVSDVFISHASEDKSYAEALVRALREAGVTVWFDRISLEWGDDLRSSIDRGLQASRFGIVIFSKAFLAKKKWTEYELSSLFAREQLGKKLILPIWHGITREDLLEYSPGFADRLAKISELDSHAAIVGKSALLAGST